MHHWSWPSCLHFEKKIEWRTCFRLEKFPAMQTEFNISARVNSCLVSNRESRKLWWERETMIVCVLMFLINLSLITQYITYNPKTIQTYRNPKRYSLINFSQGQCHAFPNCGAEALATWMNLLVFISNMNTSRVTQKRI